MTDELRIYIVVRKDIDIPKGKFGAQVAHAALSTFFECTKRYPERAAAYYDNEQPKIVLEVNSEAKIYRLCEEARRLGFVAEAIVDAGRTCFDEPTLTCVGIGPIWRDSEASFLKRVRLYTE